MKHKLSVPRRWKLEACPVKSIGKNEYVVMTDNDFKAANEEATDTIDIENFVELDDIDLMFLERPYYLVPEKNGVKGYFLLVEGMKKKHRLIS